MTGPNITHELLEYLRKGFSQAPGQLHSAALLVTTGPRTRALQRDSDNATAIIPTIIHSSTHEHSMCTLKARERTLWPDLGRGAPRVATRMIIVLVLASSPV